MLIPQLHKTQTYCFLDLHALIRFDKCNQRNYISANVVDYLTLLWYIFFLDGEIDKYAFMSSKLTIIP